MRKLAFFIILASFVPAHVFAQALEAVPRLEVGFQGDVANVGALGAIGGGGIRFHYNFNRHYAVDADITHRQQDVSPDNHFLLPPVTLGETNGLVGLRAGAREQNVGAFFRGRAGVLHFDASNGAMLLSRRNVPAFDAGITVERYHGPMILRLDLGELVIPFGNATIPGSLPPGTGHLGTHVSFFLGLGAAVRF
jgi:hypothetical protein